MPRQQNRGRTCFKKPFVNSGFANQSYLAPRNAIDIAPFVIPKSASKQLDSTIHKGADLMSVRESESDKEEAGDKADAN